MSGVRTGSIGLQLQPQTPGVADIGNAHVSGTILADTGMKYYGPVGHSIVSNCALGVGQTFSGGLSASWFSNSVFIGDGIGVTQNPNNNLQQRATIVGNTATVFQGDAVVVGYGSNSGSAASYPTASAANVVVGTLSSVLYSNGAGDATTLVGSSSTDSSLTVGSTIYGRGITGGTGGNNILVGKNINAGTNNVKNCIVLSVSGFTPSGDNQIVIGDNSHTSVTIAGQSFTSPQGALYRKKAATTVVNTVTETSLFDGTLASIAANTLRVGQMIRIEIQGFYSAGAVPGVVTIKFKLGALVKNMTMPVVVQNSAGNCQWKADIDLLITAIGAGGTTNSSGTLYIQKDNTVGTLIVGGTRGVGDALDTTVANTIDCTMTWGTADANLTITGVTALVETAF